MIVRNVVRLVLTVLLLNTSVLAAHSQSQPDLYRYGDPVVHSFGEEFFPGLVHNTSVIGTVGAKGYDEWQSWGFVEEFKPVLHVGVWNKGVSNTYKYSLRAVVLNLAPALKAEYINPVDDTSFVKTEVGKLETISFQYTLPQSWKSCLGFQLWPKDNLQLYLRGYYCAERNAEPNPEVLACVMDSFVANFAKSQKPELTKECQKITLFSR